MDNLALLTEKEVPDIEERLIEFANLCICIAERLPNTLAGRQYGEELIRSSGNTAHFYSKLRKPESEPEYHRKINLILNEIRVSKINLKIIARRPLLKSFEVTTALKEAHALYSVFQRHNTPSSLDTG